MYNIACLGNGLCGLDWHCTLLHDHLEARALQASGTSALGPKTEKALTTQASLLQKRPPSGVQGMSDVQRMSRRVSDAAHLAGLRDHSCGRLPVAEIRGFASAYAAGLGGSVDTAA